MPARPLTARRAAVGGGESDDHARRCASRSSASRRRAGIDASLLLGASPSMFTQPLCAASVLPATSVDQYVIAWLPSPLHVEGAVVVVPHAVERVVGACEAAARVGGLEGHRLAGLAPGAVAVRGQRRVGAVARRRRRHVDAQLTRRRRPAGAGGVDGAHVEVPHAVRLAGVRDAEEGRAAEHAHGVVVHVGGDQLPVAVAVEIAERDEEGTVAAGEVPLGVERAVAVAVQDADAAGGVVGRHQVGSGVLVQVDHAEGVRTVADRVVRLGRERAVAVVQQDAGVVGAPVDRGEVGLAVAVQVGGEDHLRIAARPHSSPPPGSCRCRCP